MRIRMVGKSPLDISLVTDIGVEAVNKILCAVHQVGVRPLPLIVCGEEDSRVPALALDRRVGHTEYL